MISIFSHTIPAVAAKTQPANLFTSKNFLEHMVGLRCDPLLNSLNMYVSPQSVMAGIAAHERRFERSLSIRVARAKLWNTNP